MWSLKRCPRLEPVREDNESLELLVNHGRQVDSLGGWPVWRNENRGRYDRSRLRYPSDLTDEEWGLTEPLIPPSKRGGNRRTVNVREVVNGLMYVLSTGCQEKGGPASIRRATTQARRSRARSGTFLSIRKAS